jgi:hypothetical protein
VDSAWTLSSPSADPALVAILRVGPFVPMPVRGSSRNRRPAAGTVGAQVPVGIEA